MVSCCSVSARWGLTGVAMTLDQALALFQNDNIAVTFTDDGREELVVVIDTLRGALGVTERPERRERRRR